MVYSSQPKPATTIQRSDIFPSNIPIKEDIGKLGLMWPRGTIANAHPAAKMLHQFSSSGCPLNSGQPWTTQQIIAAIKRGPHISAKDPTAAQCLHKETEEKVQSGYAKIVTWGQIKKNISSSNDSTQIKAL